jgi:Flp pilus assembly protein TadG
MRAFRHPECAPMPAAFPRSCLSTLRRLCRDRSGATAIMMATMSTVLLGFAGAGIDIAMWETNKRHMQGAADQAAYSAAIAANVGSGGSSCATGVAVGRACIGAKGITAQMGFVDGQNGVTVEVNNPPTQGNYTTNNSAWEVRISKPQQMWLANLFLSSQPTATARAVAMQSGSLVCMLILDPTANAAVNLSGNPNITTPNCSIQVNSNSSTAVSSNGNGSISSNAVRIVGASPGYNFTGSAHMYAPVTTGVSVMADPYASRTIPSYTLLPCTPVPSIPSHGIVPLVPGRYCSNINVGSATLSLTPGIYYMDRATLSTNNGTINCPTCVAGVSGVTLIFTSSTGSNWPTPTFSGNAVVDLVAPATGPTAGMVFFQDRNTPSTVTVDLGGGAGQKFTGALYFPSVGLRYGGNSGTQYCAQLIAKTVEFRGDSSFQSDCAGLGTLSMSTISLKITE